MNHPNEPWSLPWHARLKDLADTLRPEGAVKAALTARKLAARKVTARIVTGPRGSWLVRARNQPGPVYHAGR